MSKRTDQFSEMIQHELSEVLAKDFEFPHNAFVTITKVHTTPDLKNADVFISVLPMQHTDEIVGVLAVNAKHLRHILSENSAARGIPQLHFTTDAGEMFANNIDRILDELKKDENK
jgi:ribosome-binding factor A